MAEKYLMVSLEDERAKHISEVLGNKTCKKILDLLSEKELTETEIAETLKIPLNTVDYNIKKLLKTNLIEKTKNYFWSTKGKKIPVYKISNKFIVISPKKSKSYFKPIIPAIVLSTILTFFVWLFSRTAYFSQRVAVEENVEALKGAAEVAGAQAQTSFTLQSFLASIPSWGWLLIGVLIAIISYLVILIISWKRLIKL